MGYFNALTSSYFKTTQDGRKLFFPLGVWGRGYAIASEHDYEQLRRQLKIYMIVSLVLIIAACAAQQYIGAFVIAALLIAFYLAWARYYLLRGLQPSEERLSLRESIKSQADAHSTVGLWSLELLALAFVICGIIVLILSPANRLIGLASIVFFGFCAAVFTRMILIRRRSAAPRP